MGTREDAGALEHAERPLPAGNVDLVPRRTAEGVLGVGAYLGLDAERPEQAEGTTRDRRLRDVQVHRELAVR